VDRRLSVFAIFAAVSVGGIFAISAASKWAKPRAAAAAVERYGLVPKPLVRPVAAALLLTETALAAVLLLGGAVPVSATRGALAVAAVLYLTFALVVAWGRARNQAIPCGCLGDVVELRLGWPAVALNAGAAVCSAIAAVTLGADTASTTAWIAVYQCAALTAIVFWLALYAASVRGLLGQDLNRRAVS